MNVFMCTYNITLDDQLVAKAEITLEGIPMQVWLQREVESLLKKRINKTEPAFKCKFVKRRAENVLSDSELEKRFSGKPMPAIPEDSYWDEVINANSGKVIKSIEKWL